METLLNIAASTMAMSFIVCCVVSGILQTVAWTRHSVAGAPVTLKAVWRPEGHFDAIGLRQIQLARALLIVGAVAYLSYGVLMVVSRILS